MASHPSRSYSKASPGPSFNCPYCKKCTLEQYLSENGCPEATDKALFPYLEATLISDTQKMIELFALTDTAIAKNLKEAVTVVKNLVLDLVSCLEEDEYIAKIEKADTIPSIFVALRPYKSFLNYNIVNSIVTTFGSEEETKIMKDYVSAFGEFCRQSAFEIPRNIFPSSLQSRDENVLSVKLTSKGCSSLRDVISVKQTIASILGLKGWALRLCSIEEGCMCLRFLLSAKAFAQLSVPTPSQLTSLCEAGITIQAGITIPKR